MVAAPEDISLNRLNFFASIVKSIAWPLVAGFAIYAFKGKITGLPHRPKSAKAPVLDISLQQPLAGVPMNIGRSPSLDRGRVQTVDSTLAPPAEVEAEQVSLGEFDGVAPQASTPNENRTGALERVNARINQVKVVTDSWSGVEQAIRKLARAEGLFTPSNSRPRPISTLIETLRRFGTIDEAVANSLLELDKMREGVLGESSEHFSDTALQCYVDTTEACIRLLQRD
jgi:hypothetical protein